jgi:hypothetical protein
MANDAPGQSLLDDLDARQNELLHELDRLNTRIEQAIAQCSIWRSTIDPLGGTAGLSSSVPIPR